jgi:hypothetical protein
MQQATKRGFPCPNQRDLETLLVRVPLQQSHSWGRRCIVLGHKRWVTITYKRVRSGDAEDGGGGANLGPSRVQVRQGFDTHWECCARWGTLPVAGRTSPVSYSLSKGTVLSPLSRTRMDSVRCVVMLHLSLTLFRSSGSCQCTVLYSSLVAGLFAISPSPDT